MKKGLLFAVTASLVILAGCTLGDVNNEPDVSVTAGNTEITQGVTNTPTAGISKTNTPVPAATSTPKPTRTPTPSPASLGADYRTTLGIPKDRVVSTYVISVTGSYDDLYGEEKGIFAGNNWENRGRDWERPVNVKIWEPDGRLIVDQQAGVRIYGAYNRRNYIKSIKLFARESYDPENKNFKYDFFETPKLNKDADVDKYKKLVVRAFGNDYQFGWIRDEFAQELAKEAGFDDYEAIEPCILYINNEYKGFFWLHETYCDNYFKNKYGDKDKKGEFAIIEGSEQEKKTEDDDEIVSSAAAEFNEAYAVFSKLDYTIDENYDKLNEFMDVDGYLKYYAFNVYLNNKDWPDNNYKCYRYYAPEGEEYVSGTVYDGRWRFLLHDIDFSMGLYDSEQTVANFDTLGYIMKEKVWNAQISKMEENVRYSPLFTALMKRAECVNIFKAYTKEFADGVFNKDTASAILDRMNKSRELEMGYFFEYLDKLRWQYGVEEIWSGWWNYEDNQSKIRKFFEQRANASKRYVQQHFGS